MNRKLNFIIFSALIISLLVISCSKEENSLINKYWVKYKKAKPNYIVKFGDNGEYINYNRLNAKFSYQIIQNRIIFTDEFGEKEKFFIKIKTKNELKLSEINESGIANIDYFKAAATEDYFLGNWIRINKGSHYEITFEPGNNAIIEEVINGYIVKKEVNYSTKHDTTLFLDTLAYKFTFSGDIMDVVLKNPSGEKISLTRAK